MMAAKKPDFGFGSQTPTFNRLVSISKMFYVFKKKIKGMIGSQKDQSLTASVAKKLPWPHLSLTINRFLLNFFLSFG
jgi:hypothetical protein